MNDYYSSKFNLLIVKINKLNINNYLSFLIARKILH